MSLIPKIQVPKVTINKKNVELAKSIIAKASKDFVTKIAAEGIPVNIEFEGKKKRSYKVIVRSCDGEED